MKNITTILIATLAILVFTACNQQQGMQKNINAEINTRSGFLMDSLNNACTSNYDKKLDEAVASAIAVMKKAKINKKTKTKTTTATNKTTNRPKFNRPGTSKTGRPGATKPGRTGTRPMPTNLKKVKPKFKRPGSKPR